MAGRTNFNNFGEAHITRLTEDKLSNFVFVIDTNKQPLDPIHPGQARRLLSSKKAAVYRRYPFTIILKHLSLEPNSTPSQIKIDPGAKVTGLALLQGEKVIWGAELTHRGFAIRDALLTRRSFRRGRRSRKTQLQFLTNNPLLITAKGHGVRQRVITDKYGLPKHHRGRFKLSHGFKTGDIVNASIPKGKYAGHYDGLRIAIRTKPSFALYPKNGGKQFDTHCKYLNTIHKADGFAFSFVGGDSSSA